MSEFILKDNRPFLKLWAVLSGPEAEYEDEEEDSNTSWYLSTVISGPEDHNVTRETKIYFQTREEALEVKEAIDHAEEPIVQMIYNPELNDLPPSIT